jgi:hypothetical protein
VGVHCEGVEAATAVASISRWGGDNVDGRGGQEARGMEGVLGLVREGKRMGEGEKRGATTMAVPS